MQPQGSKIKIFFIILMTFLLSLSCNDEKNDVIPDIRVNFTIDLATDPEFFDLYSNPGSSALIYASHYYLGIGTGGYDNNGIIIYNTGWEGFEFYAFDRTCPHCYVTSSTSVAVNIDGIYAVCPVCNTNYAMPSSGAPTEAGPGRYYLKNYHTSLSGYFLRVWNRD